VPYLEVAGARLHYADAGSGQSPLVLVHGSSTDSTTWDGVADRLAERGRVVRYDRRGYGRSEHRPVRDHRVHARDLVAVLEQVVARPATVVGWSSGGNISLAVASQRPDLVSRLVIVEAPFHGLRHADRAVLKTALRLKVRQLRGQRERAAEEFLRFGSALQSGGNGYDRADDAVRASLIANSAPVLAEWDPHPFGVMHEHLPTRALSRIHAPVTWLLGGESSPWMRGLHAHAAKHLRSVESVVIEGAGHLVHLDQPVAFVDTVARAWRPDTDHVEHLQR
jgi:pimeloyl-ACP methyl ester carboxylesterase